MMFFHLCLFCLFWIGGCGSGESQPAVRNGIERIDSYGELLAGKSVGIVTNHTSVVDGVHSVDYLQSQGIKLARIFSPEHGFRGDADAGELVGDYTDKQSGLPVVSLYGKKKKPSPADLQGVEVMLFDIQDVGIRFYTYISTLHYVMEACAEQNIPLILTDRHHPHAGYIDGPVLKEKHRSFVGMHTVPVVYGMTIGEYARMINGEGWLDQGRRCDLTVIPCENWTRDMRLPLAVAPSPNLPDSISILLYPSTCFFEGTVCNEGRGTYQPFQVFGHPELQGMPYSYTPRSIAGMSKNPKCKDQLCYGMDLRDAYDEVSASRRLHLGWLITAYRAYQGKASFFIPYFENLSGTDKLREAIIAGQSEEEIRAAWQEELDAFNKIRLKYLLYE